MTARKPIPTWETISRAVGLLIVVCLLIRFLFPPTPEPAITLAFLGVASGLIGLPSGWALVRRNGSSNGDSSPPRGRSDS